MGPTDTQAVDMTPAPTSLVTLELTLTAIPPDEDTDNLFPLAPVQHHGGSHLHRSNRYWLITLWMRSRIPCLSSISARPSASFSFRSCLSCRIEEAGTRQSPSPTRRMGTIWRVRRSDVHLLWAREPSDGGGV